MDADDVRKMLQAACDKVSSQANWAAQQNISAAYVSDVLKHRREPGDSILKALRLERVVTYRRKARR